MYELINLGDTQFVVGLNRMAANRLGYDVLTQSQPGSTLSNGPKFVDKLSYRPGRIVSPEELWYAVDL